MTTVRTLPGYPGYLVSDCGRIQGPGRHGVPAWLKSSPNPKGYLHVCVKDSSGNIVTRYVHYLVALAFHGEKPHPKHHAAHLNGDNQDNRASNLAWKTPKENEADKKLHATA
ncbi:HNH endonuclease signature motif containing protein [Streptomyces sp. NPDC058525]|uniref:HNH endonuclease signature motif containing protein n=1 Tax=Streptomyces sp. NPDC058525 TaxID=3346538 RepID=UPI003652BD84